MDTEVTRLMQRIEAFQLNDPTATDPFSARLARENGWSKQFAIHVLQEYKRFLLLAATCRDPVTPSDAVDQAWHLHILHTREYARFCRDVLGRMLHHTPTRGGSSERNKFIAYYEATRARYAEQFGEPPPQDIWPSSAERFQPACPRRVDLMKHWAVPKPAVWRGVASRLAKARRSLSWQPITSPNVLRFERTHRMLAISIAALGCTACVTGDGMSGPTFMKVYVAFWILCLLVAGMIPRTAGAAPSADTPVLDAYDVAYLAGGAKTTVQSAVIALAAQGVISRDSSRGTLQLSDATPSEPSTKLHPVERALVNDIQRAHDVTLRDTDLQSPRLAATVQARLVSLGLIGESSRWKLGIALVAPALGALRLASRIGSDKPVGWLTLFVVAGFVIAWSMFKPTEERTLAGERKLAQLRTEHAELGSGSSVRDLASTGTLPIALGLFGMGALVGLAEWNWLLRPAYANTTNGTASGGDGCGAEGGGDDAGGGGGDSGGGCSGCGGCGGGGCS